MNYVELVDTINDLRHQLTLVDMAARSIGDRQESEAIQQGMAEAMAMADRIKAMASQGKSENQPLVTR